MSKEQNNTADQAPKSNLNTITSKEVRESFIKFFESHGHTFAKPSSVIPQNDPTLLFTNAGMNQFKDVFLGEGERPYTRAVNSQPCIRVSGKHNDLEDVGRDTSHLTSFEMVGNWSFGDYYKHDAIIWAWQFLTEVYPLPKEKLYVTVYETDDEAEALWKSLTDVRHDHVFRFGKKDNFWEMGETGPCGPCTEIHIDLGPQACDMPDKPHACHVNGDCHRYLELWNLVFIQNNREPDGSLSELPAKHVDTGMGLERLVGYLTGTYSAYMTDLFLPILNEIEKLSGVPYQDSLAGMPHRVMADHIRTVTFAISDNALPSNEGRGYVLRRLIRRALRYSQQLGFTEPVLYKLVPIVNQAMGGYLENIGQRLEFIMHMVKSEEESFLRTLSTGLTRFETVVKGLGNSRVIPGDEAFKLYDTYGFPIDLTEVMARERDLSVDRAAFEAALEHQKEQSRLAGKAHLQAQLNEMGQHKPTESYPDVVHRGVYIEAAGGGEARLVYTPEDQIKISRHHTATHLLHESLRHHLGTHVQQAGSLVDLDHLRFDFSHYHQVTSEQLAKIEEEVNQKIGEDIQVEILQMDLDSAKAMGAMCLFGEKYDDDNVRVVKIGNYSTELCGGNHVYSTGILERFKVTAEAATSAGTRRIVAIVGEENIAQFNEAERLKLKEAVQMRLQKYQAALESLSAYEKVSADAKLTTIATTVSALEAQEVALVEATKQLERQILQARNKAAGTQSSTLLDQIVPLQNGAGLLIVSKPNESLEILRTLSDNVINAKPNTVMILSSISGDSTEVLIRTPKGFSPDAKAMFATLVEKAGGKGGGRPDMAQGGGFNPEKLTQAIDDIKRQLLH